MELLVCDYCYQRDKSYVPAVDVIPEFVLARSRRRVKTKAVCAEDLDRLFPVELDAGKTGLPQVEPNEPGYVDMAEAAQISGKDTSSLGYYVGRKKLIPSARSGNKYMFKKEDVLNLAKEQGWDIRENGKKPAKVGRKRF